MRMLLNTAGVLVVLAAAGALAAETDAPVVGVGTFLHIVSDLDQSLAFYQGELGLEPRTPGRDHKFQDNPAVENLYGVPGKQFRVEVLKVPGSEMGIELVQWGEARKPEHKPLDVPGAVTLILRRTGVTSERKTLRDPDGLAVEVQRSEKPGADLRIAANDIAKASAPYTEASVFRPEGGALLIPGSSVQVQFAKAKGTSAPKLGFPEPGQGMIRLVVRHLDALIASLKSAGFSVITTGGEPVALPQGPRVVILRDPNNFYVQLMEMR